MSNFNNVVNVTPPLKYSTDERLVGEWIDGKPLYQKTLTGVASSSPTAIGTYTENSIDCIVEAKGIISDSSNDKWTTSLNIYEGSNTMCSIFFSKVENKIQINRLGSYANGNYVVTIQYTKTTDTATVSS